VDFGWLSYLWIIPVLGLLIFVHELGHFVTARLNGIRVDEFGFGFPPRMFGIKRGGVIYSLNWIPVGGFVRIYGENGDDAAEPYSFASKRPWQRAVVLGAGSFMNLLLAFLIFAIIAMVGIPRNQGAVVENVLAGSPAAAAGLRPGDKLKSVGGVAIVDQEDVREVVSQSLDRELTVVVDRGGRQIPIEITPSSARSEKDGAMGVGMRPERVVQQRYSPLGALALGARQTWEVLGAMVTGIATFVTGRAPGEVAGPLGIAQATSEMADRGGFRFLVNWTALLSLNLFLINLLPLPALDGGRLVFVLLEAVRGKKVNPRREAFVHAFGIILLLTFLVVISFFDLQRIFEGRAFLP
jgi:regulator of sigma E protease